MPFLRARSVLWLAVAVLLAVVLVILLGRGGLPFDRPAVGSTALAPNLIGQLVQFVFALFVIFIASRRTRKRSVVDFEGRTPDKAIAKTEMLWLLAYGVVVLFAGGLKRNWHASPRRHLRTHAEGRTQRRCEIPVW